MKRVSKLIIVAFVVLLPLPVLAADIASDSPPFAPPKLSKKERQALREQTTQQTTAQEGQTASSGQAATGADDSSVTAVTEEIKLDVETEVEDSKPIYSPRSATAKQHMSTVAKTVESLVRFSVRTEDKGIGTKVRVIAQAQSRSADLTNKALDKAGSRHKGLKLLLGPDYKTLKNIKQEVAKNRLRIKSLEATLKDTTNEADKTELQKQIDALKEQNTILSNELEETTQGFSLLGWMFKLIYKY